MASTEDAGTHMRVQELCTKKSWWRVPHLIKLNILLLIPFMASYVGGFDGSMLNGIQTVPKWQKGKCYNLLWRPHVVHAASEVQS